MKTNSQIIAEVKKELAFYKAKVSSIENILSRHKPKVTAKYSMGILVNGSGITHRFNEDDIHSAEYDLANLLAKAGVNELDYEGAYAEFSSATLDYLIGEMAGSYLEIDGENIRYYTKNKRAWNYLTPSVVIEIHKLPESQEDRDIAKNKTEARIVEDLISNNIVSESGD